MLKDPVLFSWVTEQINKDREENASLIRTVFEAVKPWLNIELYKVLEEKKQKEENKILQLSGTDSLSKVETTNAFDTFMKNLGINPNELKDGR